LVHKAQGSKSQAVMLPVVPQHYMMPQHNPLYTAVTRTKAICILAGNRRAIGMAMCNDQVAKPFTALG
jgi:exodeoxyribonuclease V alpha subunit